MKRTIVRGWMQMASAFLFFVLMYAGLAGAVTPPPPHLWSQRFGGADADYGNSVAVDPSGNIVVTGSFQGTVNFGGNDLVSAGGYDVFLVKYDANGVHQWSRSFGGPGWDTATSVTTDGSGNVAVTGSFIGTVNFGGSDLVSAGGSSDIFVAKYNTNGVHLWSQRYGDTSSEIGNSVAADGSGRVVVTGDITYFVPVIFGPPVAHVAFFLARYDLNGGNLWSYAISGPPPGTYCAPEVDCITDCYGRAVAVDGSGNVVVTGIAAGTANLGGSDLNGVFVAKYDANGAHQWSYGYGTESSYDITDDESRSIAVDGSGNVFVAGSFLGDTNLGGASLVSGGGTDVFVAKYNAAGVHQWSQGFGGTNDDAAGSVVVDGSGNVVVAGYFRGTANFGGDDLVSAGGSDIFIAKYDAAGVHLWSRKFGDTGDDSGSSVAMDGSSNLIVAGNFAGTVDFGGGNLTSLGSTDIFLAKYGPDIPSGVGGTPRRDALSIWAYPNPFNPTTTIQYTLPSAGRVTVGIYDLRGTSVATLVDEAEPAGVHTFAWNGRDDAGRAASSGVYFARVSHASKTRSYKLVLLK